MLSDPDERAHYDRYGDDEPEQGMPGGGFGARRRRAPHHAEEVDVEDIFNMFFGTGVPGGVRRQQQPQFRRRQQAPPNQLAQFMNIVPLLFLFALTFLNSTPLHEPAFSLERRGKYCGRVEISLFGRPRGLCASRPRRRRDPASAEGAAATHLRGRRRRDLRQRTTSTGNPFAGRPSPSSRSSACGAGARGGRTSGTASTSRTRRWRSSAGRPTSTRPSRNRASTCCTFAARSSTSRGDAAAATRIFLRRIAATPRPRRVNSAGTSRGAATRIVRGDETRARRYDDLDLEGIYAKYSASPAARRSGGHFAVLGINQGWDVHMVATPPLARAFSVYRRDEGYGCDSTKDSFPWQRMGRHGCWPPPDDAAQIVRGSHCGPRDKKKDGFCNFKEIAKRLMPAQWRGRAPRCAPLFVDYFPSKIARSYPFAQNPNTEPRLGCTGRRLDAAVDSLGAGLDVDAAADLDAAADSQRRLAAALPKDWAMPPAQWCREHRHDVYYLSPSVRARTNHTHRHKHADVVTCPPVCLTEDRTNTTQSVKHAPRDEPEAWPDGRRAHWNLWDASDWRDAVAAA